MFKIICKPQLFVIAFILLFVFAFFHEIIPVYEGTGYDGNKYNRIAKGGINLLKEKNMTGYHVFRYIPFIFYDILNLKEDTNSVLLFFKIFNLVSIGLSIIYFFKLAKLLNWKENTTSLGFILLFISFPILKFVNYYPLLTDHLSFSLSIIGVYFYFKRNIIGLILIIFISLFNFPSLSFMFLILGILDERNKIKILKVSKQMFNLILIFISILILLIPPYFYYLILKERPMPVYSGAELNFSLLAYSFIFLYLFKIIIVKSMTKAVRETNKEIIIKVNFIFVLISILIAFLMYWVFINFDDMPNTGVSTTVSWAFRSLTMPLNFYVYHVFYFGILMTFSLIFMKSIFRESMNIGLGWFIVVLLFYVLSIQNESRILINMIVFILIPLLQYFNERKLLSNFKIYLVFFVSLILSRFYINLNHTPNMWKLMEDPNEFLKFPVQRYFMNFGPWISYEMYYLQAIIFVLILVIAFFLFRKNIHPKKVFDENEITH